MTSMTMRILIDFEDEGDKEEEDSEKSVGDDDPSDDFNTEGKCQNIVL